MRARTETGAAMVVVIELNVCSVSMRKVILVVVVVVVVGDDLDRDG